MARSSARFCLRKTLLGIKPFPLVPMTLSFTLLIPNSAPPPMPQSAPPVILVFDSGLGGLTVYREVAAARPDARFVYLADDAAFPYGRWRDEDLVPRIVSVIGDAIAATRPDLVVIACNTASTIALPQLRARFTVPFVGTVPAIKPACATSRTKRVSVLGTLATVGREYTRALIREFGNGADVELVGSARLAGFAEAELRGEPADDDAIRAEIAPCFIAENGRRTDTVVLACTHYPLLGDRLTALAPWPVTFMDPAPAIARRVESLLGSRRAAREDAAPSAQFVATSGALPPAALRASLARFGIGAFAAAAPAWPDGAAV